MTHTSKRVLAVALGILLSAGPAIAEETQQDSVAATEAAETQRELARKANERAAEDAAKAVRTASQLDLDIRLMGPTSVKIASGEKAAR